jgi:myo-inositol-1-phosphate synthase
MKSRVNRGVEWKSQERLRQQKENWGFSCRNGGRRHYVHAGVELVRTGKAQPVGSLTQLGTIRLGKRTENNSPKIKEFVPLADLDDLIFGGWDIFKDNAYEAASNAGVLSKEDLLRVKPFLSKIKPMKAAFDKVYVKRLDGTYVKKAKNKYELALQIKEDIANFKKTSRATRLVTCWCGSTEVFIRPEDVHSTPEKFIEGMKKNDPAIAPSMLYAWACVTSGVPFANGAPNLTVDIPAITKLAQEHNVALCGKDFKTGQTLMKTILAPDSRRACLDWMAGTPPTFWAIAMAKCWMICLFQNQGRIEAGRSGIHFAAATLSGTLRQDSSQGAHQLHYRPRGDNKEGWDNIDIFGWLNYKMQIKVDFLCRDSILAAPIVLDLVLFLDLAQRAGFRGIQEWLSFYFKSPMTSPELYPEHDLFIQSMKLKNTLRWLMGEELITHLGQEYYD